MFYRVWRYEAIRGYRFEAAAALVEVFRPGGSAGFLGFFLEQSLEGLVVPREVRGRWALLRLIPSRPLPNRTPSTLRQPAAYERPPNTPESLSPLSPCFSLARNVIYLFTRFTLTRFSAQYHLPVGEIKKLQAFMVHRVECQLVLARSRFLARTVICRIVGIRGLNWGSSRSECDVIEEIAELVVAVTLRSKLSIRVGRSVE